MASEQLEKKSTADSAGSKPNFDAVSNRIRERVLASGGRYFANDSIAEHIQPGELEELEAEVAGKVASVLSSLVIDTENDHNSNDTARRVAKMYVREVFAGRYTARPSVTDFPNEKRLDEIAVVGPIAVRSACSHHMVPIMGHAWIGFIPGDRVIGLSKYHRLAEWVMTRPQIQEEAVVELADQIEQASRPRGLGVVVKAKHLCCGWRGVRDEASEMTTSVMRGLLRTNPDARAEFMRLIGGGFQCR